MILDRQRTGGATGLWALIVGINGYSERPLRGCLNDVEALCAFLTDRLDTPPDHILALCDAQATRSAILDSFQTFLIANPAIEYGDQILFHFSGHGSQMPDRQYDEPDGFNECLVPYDSRESDCFDIPDKTIANLLAQLAQAKGTNITVMLDCCHSGSGTRDEAALRCLPADPRIPPAGLDREYLVPLPLNRGASLSGWHGPGMPYVLLSACRDSEQSQEHRISDSDGAPMWYGPLTYFMLRGLHQLPMDCTYADLIEYVAVHVNGLYPAQMPQCEGDRDRLVFSGLQRARRPLFLLQTIDGAHRLSAGLLHGIQPGMQLALYPWPDQPGDAADPIATAEVESVTATQATAIVAWPRHQAIPPTTRAALMSHGTYPARQRVFLDPQVGRGLIAELAEALRAAGDSLAGSVRLVADPALEADLKLVVSGGELVIQDAGGGTLAKPEELYRREQPFAQFVLTYLESIARYRLVLGLTNPNPDSALRGAIDLKLSRLVPAGGEWRMEALPAIHNRVGGGIALPFYERRADLNHYTVAVLNDSALMVYPHLFVLGADYCITRLYPLFNQQERLASKHTLHIHADPLGGGSLEIYLPAGWDRSNDRLKAIVTTHPCDLRWLEQDPTAPAPLRRVGAGDGRSTAERLLGTIAPNRPAGHRGPFARMEEDWGTVELGFTVVRAS